VENWNSANAFIYFARGGEIASNRVDDQPPVSVFLNQ
jgi:TnpA family transposase